jgi:hypothetical protein
MYRKLVFTASASPPDVRRGCASPSSYVFTAAASPPVRALPAWPKAERGAQPREDSER